LKFAISCTITWQFLHQDTGIALDYTSNVGRHWARLQHCRADSE